MLSTFHTSLTRKIMANMKSATATLQYLAN